MTTLPDEHCHRRGGGLFRLALYAANGCRFYLTYFPILPLSLLDIQDMFVDFCPCE